LWRDPNPENFQQWLETGTLWVPLVLILCMIAHTLMPLPAELLAVAAGALLGVFWGFLTIWIGAMLGAYFGFFLARSFGQGLVQRLAHGQRLQRLQGWLQRPDIGLLLAVRLVPVISFNLVNFALGCTKVGWWRFTWTTGLGIVPVTAAMVGLGAHLHNWRVMLVLSLAAVALGGYWVLRACSIPSVARVSSGANPLTERRVSPLGSEGGADDAPND
jgi:uncharacterized membrane protein YdjX (TVP38/TMEM64 family)